MRITRDSVHLTSQLSGPETAGRSLYDDEGRFVSWTQSTKRRGPCRVKCSPCPQSLRSDGGDRCCLRGSSSLMGEAQTLLSWTAQSYTKRDAVRTGLGPSKQKHANRFTLITTACARVNRIIIDSKKEFL